MRSRKLLCAIMSVLILLLSAGCSSQEPQKKEIKAEPINMAAILTEEGKYRAPQGTYFSELTGLPISDELKDKRPIAVCIDNEIIAWNHYGTAEADIIYEMMNSTHNGRITRFLAFYKDYDNIPQIGNIRSSRSSNYPIMAEYNAFLCHDGGPKYVKDFYAKGYAKQRFNGCFSRVPNGKNYEYTEYILAGEISELIAKRGYSPYYNEYRPERDSHFLFVDYGTETDLSQYAERVTGLRIDLPFPHNQTELRYNAETGTYDYYGYGMLHIDEDDKEVLTFKNVLLQDATWFEYDNRGYMRYDEVATGRSGWYLTNGYAIPVTWSKTTETGITRFFDLNGNEILLNRGKTYVGIVPNDVWKSVVIE